jgi:acyl-CoA thioester hydrolase
LKIDFLARDAADGAKLSKASSVQVAVDSKTNEMQWQTPPILREKLAPYL